MYIYIMYIYIYIFIFIYIYIYLYIYILMYNLHINNYRKFDKDHWFHFCYTLPLLVSHAAVALLHSHMHHIESCIEGVSGHAKFFSCVYQYLGMNCYNIAGLNVIYPLEPSNIPVRAL